MLKKQLQRLGKTVLGKADDVIWFRSFYVCLSSANSPNLSVFNFVDYKNLKNLGRFSAFFYFFYSNFDRNGKWEQYQ